MNRSPHRSIKDDIRIPFRTPPTLTDRHLPTPRRDVPGRRSGGIRPGPSPRNSERPTGCTSPRQRRSSREQRKGSPLDHEFRSPMHSRRILADNMSSSFKTPQAEPPGTHFCGEDEKNKNDLEVAHRRPGGGALGDGDFHACSLSDGEAPPPVGVVVKERSLFDTPSEDVSVITEFTREHQSRQFARRDNSPELKRRQGRPLPRFPVETVYSEGSSSEKSSKRKEARECSRHCSSETLIPPKIRGVSRGVSRRSKFEDHPVELTTSSEGSSVGESKSWYIADRRMDPDASMHGDNSRQTSDPPTDDGEDFSVVSNTRSPSRRPDAPIFPAANIRFGPKMRHVQQQLSSVISQLDAPPSSEHDKPALFTADTTASTSTDLDSVVDRPKKTNLCNEPDAVLSITQSLTLSTEQDRILCRDPSGEEIGENHSGSTATPRATPHNSSISSAAVTKNKTSESSDPALTISEDSSVEQTQHQSEEDLENLDEEPISPRTKPAASFEATSPRQPLGSSGLANRAPIMVHHQTDSDCVEPKERAKSPTATSNVVTSNSARDTMLTTTSGRASSPLPRNYVPVKMIGDDVLSAATKPRMDMTPVSPEPLEIDYFAENKERTEIVPHRDSDIPISYKSCDSGVLCMARRGNGSSEESRSSDESSGDESGSLNTQDYLLPVNSLVDDEAGEVSAAAEVAGIKELFCCGAYGSGNREPILRPQGYPTMPHPKAALVHVMETIQEVDTASSSRDELSNAKVQTHRSREGSPVLQPLTVTDSEPREAAQPATRQNAQQPFPLIFAEDEPPGAGKVRTELQMHPREQTGSQKSESVLVATREKNFAPVIISEVNSPKGFDNFRISQLAGSRAVAGTTKSSSVSCQGEMKHTETQTISKIGFMAVEPSHTANFGLGPNTMKPSKFLEQAPIMNHEGATPAKLDLLHRFNPDRTEPKSYAADQNEKKKSVTLNKFPPRIEMNKTLVTTPIQVPAPAKKTADEAADHEEIELDDLLFEVHSRGACKEGGRSINEAEQQGPSSESTSAGCIEQQESLLSTSFDKLMKDDDNSVDSSDSLLKAGSTVEDSTVGESTAFFDAEENLFDADEGLDEESAYTNNGSLPPLPKDPLPSSTYPGGSSDLNHPRIFVPESPASCAAGAQYDLLKSLFGGGTADRESVGPAAPCGTPRTTNRQDPNEAGTPRTTNQTQSGPGITRVANDGNLSFELPRNFPPGAVKTKRNAVLPNSLQMMCPKPQEQAKNRISSGNESGWEFKGSNAIGTSQRPPRLTTKKQNVHRSASLIQRNVRGMLARKVFLKTIYCVVHLQSEARRRRCMRLLTRLKIARQIFLYAATIQRWCRRWLASRRVAWLRAWTKAATVVQAEIRRHLAVRAFKKARFSAIHVQARFRRNSAFAKFQLSKTSVLAIQKNARRSSALEKFRMAKASAICVQNACRRWARVRRYQLAKESAVTIQAFFRGAAAVRHLQRARHSVTTIQARWRSFSGRENFLATIRKVILAQKNGRAWSAARYYGALRKATLQCQAIRRGAVARRSFSSTRRKVITLQNFIRLKTARKLAESRKRALITIQAYERRRQARKALKGAKIAWQIETAFSYSSNPATMPIPVSENPGWETPMVALMDTNSDDSTMATIATLTTFGKTRDGTVATRDYEGVLPSGCPPMVVLVNGRPGKAIATNSEDSGGAIKSGYLPKACDPLGACAKASGSASFDESFLPTQVFSELSGVTTQDELSSRGPARDNSSGFITSEVVGSTKKAATTPESLKKSCQKVLGFADSFDDKEVENAQRIDNPEQPARALGGFRIVFQDTIEYEEDRQKVGSMSGSHRGSGLMNGSQLGSAEDNLLDHLVAEKTCRVKSGEQQSLADEESRQTVDDSTLDDTTARDVDTFDSSYLDEPLRRNDTLTSRSGRTDPITEFLEAALDYICLTPANGIRQLWGSTSDQQQSSKSGDKNNAQNNVQPPAKPPQRRPVEQETPRATLSRNREGTPRVSNTNSRAPRSARSSSNRRSASPPRPANSSSNRRSASPRVPRKDRGDHHRSRQSRPPPIQTHPQISQRSSRSRQSTRSSTANHRTPVVATEEDSDLIRNEQLFHLLANMLVEFFQAKLVHGKNSIVLHPKDKQQIELLLPEQKKARFVDAVRHRLSVLAHETNEQTKSVTLECQRLGFDREGSNNPIFAAAGMRSEIIEIDLSSAGGNVAEETLESLKPVGSSLSEAPPRLQLAAELRTATNLMNESENPETRQFWKNHIAELQRRLDATMYGEKLFGKGQEYDPPILLNSRKEDSSHVQQQQQYAADSESSCMVDVISPADLPGGYHFEAEIEGQRFLATVPPGGVRQGETFACVMRELDSVAVDIPVGYWKDGLGDGCKHGCCHASVCNSIFCPLIALAQIGQRIQLDFVGRAILPDSEQPFQSNRSMMCIIIMFWLIVNCAIMAGYYYKWDLDLDISFADYSALALINIAMVGFTVFVTQSVRYSLREKFMIREERCYDLEDVVCSAFCLPCVVCQMQRHTANYDEYPAVCCSETGLPDGVGVHPECDRPEKSAYLV